MEATGVARANTAPDISPSLIPKTARASPTETLDPTNSSRVTVMLLRALTFCISSSRRSSKAAI